MKETASPPSFNRRQQAAGGSRRSPIPVPVAPVSDAEEQDALGPVRSAAIDGVVGLAICAVVEFACLRFKKPDGRCESIRLYAQGLYNLGPFLGLLRDQLAEFVGRAREGCGAQVGKPRLHLGLEMNRLDLVV